jgi:hypothetical protein
MTFGLRELAPAFVAASLLAAVTSQLSGVPMQSRFQSLGA